jgi:conjugal transfer ATP-binding protein TraC
MTDENTTPTNTDAPATGEVRITNVEKKGSPTFGIAEQWKNKLQAKKDKKAQAEQAKDAKLAKEMGDADEFFENFDPKTDKKKLTIAMRQRIVEAEKEYQRGVISAKDLVAPSAMEVGNTDIKLNGMFVKSFFVFSYPRYLESNWMNSLVNFDASLDISIFVYPTNSLRMMKILRKKVAQMLSTKHINEKKGVVADVGLDTALEDAEQLRVDLQRGTEKFFQVGFYFTLYADSQEKLDKTAKQLETILGGQLVMTRTTDFRTERGFESTLPQATDMIEVVRNMNTSPLSTTFPFVSSDLTSNEGILYGINRHNNSLIIFDRFNLENANQVVFAKSGAGKSYAVKLEILRSLMFGTDVIVIDPENEYEALAKTVGGSYIKVSLTSDQRINPFDLPLSVHEDDARPGELLRENAIALSGLMSIMLGKLNPEEEALMDKAILQTYELKGITTTTENPHELEMPVMADLKNVLDTMDGGKSLATRLEKYTNGTFSGLFSDQTNVDLESGLVVFCIRDLEEQLRPVSMYILINFIWNKVRSKLKKRLLVIDEAWHMVQYEDSGRFLHNLTKRARKYYLGVTTITQDVEDFMDSKWGKPIITNSSMQLLLRQAPVAMEKLQKTFNLTESEKYLLLNSGVGQGLFFAGNQHVAIHVIASFGENKIVTTNPEEILAMKKEE